MRMILFRGKQVDSKEWIHGSLITGVFTRGGQDIPYILSPYKAEYDCFEDFYEENGIYEVDPETVCQYTGLTDKNGRKIFEGDYISCKQYVGGNQISRCVELGYVEMKHGAFGLHRKQGYYRPFKDWLEDYKYEVIGNIFDNPELIAEVENETD